MYFAAQAKTPGCRYLYKIYLDPSLLRQKFCPKYILYMKSNMQEWRKKQSRNCGVRLSEWVRRLGK